MSDPRDDLAALINGAPIPKGATIGTKRERKAYQRADAILAAGWRPPLKAHPPHAIDVERAPYCNVCGRDIQWDDNTESWTH
jgi:hypothetical protein